MSFSKLNVMLLFHKNKQKQVGDNLFLNRPNAPLKNPYVRRSRASTTNVQEDAENERCIEGCIILQPIIPYFHSLVTLSLMLTNGANTDAKQSHTAKDIMNVSLLFLRLFLLRSIIIIARFPGIPMQATNAYAIISK